ncbi:hypothetical protein H4R33_007238, partial [Dimargaris cristalligena]
HSRPKVTLNPHPIHGARTTGLFSRGWGRVRLLTTICRVEPHAPALPIFITFWWKQLLLRA